MLCRGALSRGSGKLRSLTNNCVPMAPSMYNGSPRVSRVCLALAQHLRSRPTPLTPRTTLSSDGARPLRLHAGCGQPSLYSLSVRPPRRAAIPLWISRPVWALSLLFLAWYYPSSTIAHGPFRPLFHPRSSLSLHVTGWELRCGDNGSAWDRKRATQPARFFPLSRQPFASTSRRAP
jgi:hypothetical protein